MNLTIKKRTKYLIGVTIGDIKGIGIPLLIKEFNNKKISNFILITNENLFYKNTKFPRNKVNVIKFNQINYYDNKKLNILTYETKSNELNTIKSLEIGYKLNKFDFFNGLLTLPLNKEKINKKISTKFIDQTTYFSQKENKKDSNMIFYYKNKFFIPLTIHIELKNVIKFFQKKKLTISKIESLIKTLKEDFNIKKPKLILAGINPHAGENKVISNDEEKYLKPVINYFKKKSINIIGPVSGDSIINDFNLKYFDAFIFTYHDQALIPFKILSNFGGVNFTSNLDIIRVSPSHGTAENLKNLKSASSEALLNSFKLIKKIYNNRK